VSLATKVALLTGAALVSMMVIVTSVVFRGVAVEPSLRGSSLHVFSIIRPGVFEAIGVISFAVRSPITVVKSLEADIRASLSAITTPCSSTKASKLQH